MSRPTDQPGTRWKIRVVCTDKGQHAESSFGHVIVEKLHGRFLVMPFLDHHGDEYTEPVEALFDPGREPLPDPVRDLPDRLRKTYPLECRRCKRNTPLRIDTLEKICPAFAEADMLKIDISRLSA